MTRKNYFKTVNRLATLCWPDVAGIPHRLNFNPSLSYPRTWLLCAAPGLEPGNNVFFLAGEKSI
ncbi:hypothetical protein AQUSIP_03290 [Aquicella siphonis]|uniref:Uncharacterized protein n=1 Tax=Aquicella siphonis TaxID=254247 RepID=A0A5E4PE13_9COXI|nr:hypothetical protein [Aquicella siphonis]VVC75054.1 hypothetical protein AQUSIP_03290 [Aquicella siphonis]